MLIINSFPVFQDTLSITLKNFNNVRTKIMKSSLLRDIIELVGDYQIKIFLNQFTGIVLVVNVIHYLYA